MHSQSIGLSRLTRQLRFEDLNPLLLSIPANIVSSQPIDQDIQVNGNTAVERSTSDVRGVYGDQRFDGTYSSTRTSSVGLTARGRSSAWMFKR